MDEIKVPKEVMKSVPRATARARMIDDSYWKAPIGTPVLDYFKKFAPEWIPTEPEYKNKSDGQHTLIAAIVNGSLRELTFQLRWDAGVQPVFISDSDGWRIYRRSLAFVLVIAIRDLFPDRRIRINHSVPFGGYYCEADQGEQFTEAELQQIKALMDEIIAADEPITREAVPLEDVIAYYEDLGDTEKLNLLKNRERDFLILYTLRDMRDYFHGYMVPSTGYLVRFDLILDDPGFILRFPRRVSVNVIHEPTNMTKLRQVFSETASWHKLLNVRDLGSFNELVRKGRVQELILASEALHERRYAEIAAEIASRQPDARLVTLAGPSSSGKTTSSKRLAIQLLARGLKPYTIGMDNYFVDRDRTPKDEAGELDFEHIKAVDVGLFNEQVLRLMDGEEVQIPHYNFIKGRQEKGEKIRLTHEHILIVEGIHALNPELVRDIPRERVFKLYISALTQLNIDRYNRIPTTDIRLLRRMVRDVAHRGVTAEETLNRWPSVRRGERNWIFPHQENADMIFNSALAYELAALRPIAEPMLLAIHKSADRYLEVKRLLAILKWVEPIKDLTLIPSNSILREFIGGSNLRDYTPGHERGEKE